jgi:hypothetical protein
MTEVETFNLLKNAKLTCWAKRMSMKQGVEIVLKSNDAY